MTKEKEFKDYTDAEIKAALKEIAKLTAKGKKSFEKATEIAQKHNLPYEPEYYGSGLEEEDRERLDKLDPDGDALYDLQKWNTSNC